MNDDAKPTEGSTHDTYIHLPEDHPLRSRKEYELRTPEAPDFFGPVRRVNVLVGPNNAGKSRFMRALHGAKKLVRGPGPFADWRHAREVAASLPRELPHLLARISGNGWPAYFPTGSGESDARRDVVTSISEHQISECLRLPFPSKESHVARQLAYHHYIESKFGGQRSSESRLAIGEDMLVYAWTDDSSGRWRDVLVSGGRHYARVLHGEPARLPQDSLRTVYFPALRTALSVQGDTNALESSLSECYGLPITHPNAIVTGRRLYDQLDAAVRGRRKERLRFSAFETWLSTRFFSGVPLTLVPRHATGSERPTIAVEIDGEERELENLGDGLQQLIILTFPLFMADEGDAFFIEEPETHMHPGLQRAFLEVLFSEELAKKNLLVFLTTHSNHLMAAALERPDDVSLFRFHRLPRDNEKETVETSLPRFEVTHVSNRDIALLQALGVMNGSVFLAQCQIWVEGPSDITYFKAYLKSLEAAWEAWEDERFERLLENRDYVFVMYGGSLLDTINFDAANVEDTSAFGIGNRILVIADADDGKRDKHDRLESLARRSVGQMVYRKLEVREVENTVAAKHLKRAMQSLYKGMRDVVDDGVFDVPGKAYLGRHFKRKGVKLIDSYVSRSGSWNDKTSLANEVSKGPLPWSDLRPTTQDLTLALDRFIRDACGYTQPSRP